MKKALITGGAKRLGKSIALALSEFDFDIAITYNSSEKEVDNLRKAIDSKGCEFLSFKANFEYTEEIHKLFYDYKSKWEKVDLIINNAGVFPLSKFREISESDWDKTFAINLKSVFFLCQKFSDIINEGGNIINISSIGGLEIWKDRLLYNVSKSALITLTKSLARELAPKIRVNSIAPGILQLERIDQYNLISAEKIPLKKYGNQSNIIETIKFIINNDYLTGAIIPVDGGKILT